MNNQHILHIKSIISAIEKTNALLENFKDGNDIVDNTVQQQIQRKKKQLFKELLASLLTSNLSISSYERLYQKTFAFLKQDEEKMIISADFEQQLQKAEGLLV